MSREWKPGDVAMIVPPAEGAPEWCRGEPEAAVHYGYGWALLRDIDYYWPDDGRRDFQARPLVVIDAEDREQVERLAESYVTNTGTAIPVLMAADRLRRALRSLIEPPKPEEPTGLGAVIEDADGTLWVRTRDTLAPWQRHNSTAGRYFGDIDAIRVLSEGVTA